MADCDPEHGEKKKAKRSDSWMSKIVCQLLPIIDALKPSSELTNAPMKSRNSGISTARFRRSSTSPNAAARLQEAREAGMSVWMLAI